MVGKTAKQRQGHPRFRGQTWNMECEWFCQDYLIGPLSKPYMDQDSKVVFYTSWVGEEAFLGLG